MKVACVLALLCVSVTLGLEYLPDPSFENPVSPNWEVFGLGYSVNPTVKVTGLQSICANAGASTSDSYGAYKWLWIGQVSPAPLRLSGWSLSNTTVSTPSDANYALYSDIAYLDGSYQWGVNIPFAAGSAHTWQYQVDTVISDKAISSLTVYPIFRYHSGQVCFDEFSVSTYTLPTPVTSSTNPLRILFPLYIYPGSAWDAIQTAASSVPITAIANPNSGPGSSVDSSYVTYINKLAKGSPAVPVIGYVHTSWGWRSIATVKSEIDAWKSFYGNVSGIFLDEASTNLDQLGYYNEVADYVRTVFGSNAIVHLNPGLSTPENYTAFSDSIMTFENDYSSFVASLSSGVLPLGWPRAPGYTSYTATWKYKSNAAIYGVSSANYQAVVDLAISRGFGHVFITDETLPNPYGALPSYWTSLVSYIASKNV